MVLIALYTLVEVRFYFVSYDVSWCYVEGFPFFYWTKLNSVRFQNGKGFSTQLFAFQFGVKLISFYLRMMTSSFYSIYFSLFLFLSPSLSLFHTFSLIFFSLFFFFSLFLLFFFSLKSWQNIECLIITIIFTYQILNIQYKASPCNQAHCSAFVGSYYGTSIIFTGQSENPKSSLDGGQDCMGVHCSTRLGNSRGVAQIFTSLIWKLQIFIGRKKISVHWKK